MESENLSLLIWLCISDGQKTDSSKVVSFIGIYNKESTLDFVHQQRATGPRL